MAFSAINCNYLSDALVQREQVVGLFAISLGLEVLVTEAANRDDYIRHMTTSSNVKTPLTCLNTLNGFLLGQFPIGAIWINAAHCTDTFVSVLTVSFIDALNFMTIGHVYSLSSATLRKKGSH